MSVCLSVCNIGGLWSYTTTTPIHRPWYQKVLLNLLNLLKQETVSGSGVSLTPALKARLWWHSATKSGIGHMTWYVGGLAICMQEPTQIIYSILWSCILLRKTGGLGGVWKNVEFCTSTVSSGSHVVPSQYLLSFLLHVFICKKIIVHVLN